jgi:hypothetical protein
MSQRRSIDDDNQPPLKRMKIEKNKYPNKFVEIRRDKSRIFRDNTQWLHSIMSSITPHQCLLRSSNTGKTMLLDMIHSYHGLEYNDEYNELFGGLNIDELEAKPQPNQYLVLRTTLTKDCESFSKLLLQSTIEFHERYSYLFHGTNIKTDFEDDSDENILFNIGVYLNSVVFTLIDYCIMWLVDDWDNFSICSVNWNNKDFYQNIKGNTIEIMKDIAAFSINYSFIVGRNKSLFPQTISHIWNSQNVSQLTNYSEILGITDDEIVELLNDQCDSQQLEEILQYCRANCGGYQITNSGTKVCHTQHTIAAIEYYMSNGRLPDKAPYSNAKHTPSIIFKYLNLKDNRTISDILLQYIIAFRDGSSIEVVHYEMTMQYFEQLAKESGDDKELLKICSSFWLNFGNLTCTCAHYVPIIFMRKAELYRIPNLIVFDQFIDTWKQVSNIPLFVDVDEETDTIENDVVEKIFNNITSLYTSYLPYNEVEKYGVSMIDLLLYSSLQESNYNYEVVEKDVFKDEKYLNIALTNKLTSETIILELRFLSLNDLLLNWNYFDKLEDRYKNRTKEFKAKSLEQQLKVRLSRKFISQHMRSDRAIELYQTVSDYISDAEIQLFTYRSRLQKKPVRAAVCRMIGKDYYLIRNLSNTVSASAQQFLSKHRYNN